ncbi:MAG: YcjF family protein [Cyanobium sp.]
MPRRLWLWILLALAALLVVGMVLQALNLLMWQLSAWIPAWLVGPLLLLLLAALGLAAAQLGWPWLQALRRKGGPRQQALPAQAPSSRREAAERNLEAIERTLERVRDAVEREALEQERRRVQSELERGDLHLVVFGAGSVGKTSLIRALLQELVGKVGAAMGSTTTSSRYRLRLRGLERAVLLEDTPGILEGGAAGHEREELARLQAARADLLVLVVDGDLRAAELEVFETLAVLGKRLLLVLNKCDLRGEREEERLLALLQRRTSGRIAPEDVIAASASPQSVPMPGGRPLQPSPEVEALVRRLAAVLRADGEELIADNLLLQCRQLGEASRSLLDQQRRRDAEAIVERTMWIGAGVLAVTPLPGLDLLGTAAVQAQMVLEIGKVYGVTLDRPAAQELALTVGRSLAGLGMVKGGVALLGSALSLNLPALLVSRALQACTAAWLTRVAGRSVIVYFQQDQDWGDGGLPEVLQREYELNRREGLLRSFLEMAMRRVVEPLGNQTLRLPPRPLDTPGPAAPDPLERRQGAQEPPRRRPPPGADAGDPDGRAG